MPMGSETSTLGSPRAELQSRRELHGHGVASQLRETSRGVRREPNDARGKGRGRLDHQRSRRGSKGGRGRGELRRCGRGLARASEAQEADGRHVLSTDALE